MTRKDARMIAEELYKLMSGDVKDITTRALENTAEEQWMSTRQAAEYLGLSQAYIKKHVDDIPHVKVGRLNKFTRRSLDAWAKRS